MHGQAPVVAQMRVVACRAQEAGHGVLLLHHDVEQRLAEHCAGFRVDVDDSKRHLLAAFEIQHLVACAAQEELVKLRDADVVVVKPRIDFCNQNAAHHGVNRLRFGLAVEAFTQKRLACTARIFGVERIQPVQQVVVDAHSDQITDTHVAPVADNARIAHAGRIVVNEEFLKRHVLQLNFAARFHHDYRGVKQRDRLAHWREEHSPGFGLLDHLHVLLLIDPLNLIRRHVRDIAVFCYLRIIPPKFHYAQLLEHGVLHGVVERLVAVGAEEQVVDIERLLVGQCGALWAVGDVFNDLVSVQEDTQQGWARVTHSIAHSRCDDIRAPADFRQVRVAVVVFLRPLPIWHEVRIDEVDSALDFCAEFALHVLDCEGVDFFRQFLRDHAAAPDL